MEFKFLNKPHNTPTNGNRTRKTPFNAFRSQRGSGERIRKGTQASSDEQSQNKTAHGGSCS